MLKRVSEDPALWYCPATSGKAKAPVLFLHGMWGWHWYWSHFVDAFCASGRAAYALDLRGHGPAWSAPVEGDLSLDVYFDDLVAAVESIEAASSQPVLVGHSMGGILAQWARERSLARAIVLLGSAVPQGLWASPTWRTALTLMKYLPQGLLGRAVFPSEKEVMRMVFHSVSGEELEKALARYVPESGRAYFRLLTSSVRIDANRGSGQVLIVGGGRDRMIGLRATQRLAKLYGTEALIFDELSHWLIREDGWRKLCSTVLEWLDVEVDA